ncbi:MAG: glutamate--tRNA ligase [Candidatus Aenigmatarchaeota archaeon]
MEKIIRKYALQNAVFFNGKANASSVVGKVMAENPDLRARAKEVIESASRITGEVNQMLPEAQRKELEKISPQLLEKKEKSQREELPELKNAKSGKVVLRFSPEPNGYPHIGHAKAVLINEYYAKKYKAKMILRFDDTNPAKEKKEYYKAIKDGLDWLGVKFDIVKNASDNMETIYSFAEKLIRAGKAYVCACDQEKIKRGRMSAKACRHRNKKPSGNLKDWKKMFSEFKQNQAILRLKGDMESKNSVMRDPTLFRIIDAPHSLCGKKYRVYPTYDFSIVVEDRVDGITHAMRSKEYELRDELYNTLFKMLGFKPPALVEFSRLDLEGTPVSKRYLKPLIDDGTIKAWDDPRLPTLAGLRRRGFVPEAIREFIISLGLTRSESVLTWENMESFNRKALDPIANRYYFVADPIKCVIKNAPEKTIVKIPLHPDRPEKTKDYTINGKDLYVYVSRNDIENIKSVSKIRLMHLFNIYPGKVTKSGITAKYAGNEKLDAKIQWVPKDAIKTKLMIPHKLFIGETINKESLTEKEGLAEPAITKVKLDEKIQFERVGFARLDSKGEELTFILAHR